MNQKLTTELASEIARLHNQAEDFAEQTKASAQDALSAAVQCGRHIDQVEGMTKGKLLAWLRDNVPGLTPERAKAYLSLFHVHQEREAHAIDHRQLILLGVVEKAEAQATQRTAPQIGAGKWVGWIGNVRGWFTKTTRERPLSDWTSDERQAVKDQIKPLIDIYNQLDGE